MDEFIEQLLTHSVDLFVLEGTDSYGNPLWVFQKRIPCLVDTASGKRIARSPEGVVVTYDYGITCGARTPLEVHMLLRDARDEQNVQIFDKASLEVVRVFRQAGVGIVGYHGLARSLE